MVFAIHVTFNRFVQPGLLSKTFLRNLVMANDIYVHLLEKCVKTGRLSTVKKRKKTRRRKKKAERTQGDSFLSFCT